MEIMTAFILLGVLSLGGIGAMSYCVFRLVGIVKSMGDQLTANSGHQLERIKYESGAEAVKGYVSRISPSNNGYAPSEPVPDMFVPDRTRTE